MSRPLPLLGGPPAVHKETGNWTFVGWSSKHGLLHLWPEDHLQEQCANQDQAPLSNDNSHWEMWNHSNSWYKIMIVLVPTGTWMLYKLQTVIEQDEIKNSQPRSTLLQSLNQLKVVTQGSCDPYTKAWLVHSIKPIKWHLNMKVWIFFKP